MIPKNKTEAHEDGIFVTKHAKNEIRSDGILVKPFPAYRGGRRIRPIGFHGKGSAAQYRRGSGKQFYNRRRSFFGTNDSVKSQGY